MLALAVVGSALLAGPAAATNARPATTVQVTGVAAGWDHGLALLSGGAVRAWGWNGSGQLGDGTVISRSTAVAVTGLPTVAAIAAGNDDSFAITADGTLRAWGANFCGQLGDGSSTDRHTPVVITGLPKVSQVSAGWAHTLAVGVDGSVWAWGADFTGQLGDGSSTDRHTPQKVSGLPKVVQVAAGGDHSLALGADGSVWAWGANWAGQVGDGAAPTVRSRPVKVSGTTAFVQVAAGWDHSLAVTAGGAVWAWGGNWAHQLGNRSGDTRSTPVQIYELTGIASVAAGNGHSLALGTDGTVRAWGMDVTGELGVGSVAYYRAPAVQPHGLGAVSQVAAGVQRTFVVTRAGAALAWGASWVVSLGDGEDDDAYLPVAVAGLAGG